MLEVVPGLLDEDWVSIDASDGVISTLDDHVVLEVHELHSLALAADYNYRKVGRIVFSRAVLCRCDELIM